MRQFPLKILSFFTVLVFMTGCSVRIDGQESSILIQPSTATSSSVVQNELMIGEISSQTKAASTGSVSGTDTLLPTLELEPSVVPSPTSVVEAPSAIASAPAPTATPTPALKINRSSVVESLATAAPLPAETDVQNTIRSHLLTAHLGTDYSLEAVQFIDHLLAHLHEFNLTSLGITTEHMQGVLMQDRAGDRVNALVQEVWGEWLLLSVQQGFDVRREDPTYEKQGLSPFRRLVVRLVQGRQEGLTDSQQHALYGFFSRIEQDATWRNDMDSIIGAVNRESFLWTYKD